jgi:hypothetical protein
MEISNFLANSDDYFLISSRLSQHGYSLCVDSVNAQSHSASTQPTWSHYGECAETEPTWNKTTQIYPSLSPLEGLNFGEKKSAMMKYSNTINQKQVDFLYLAFAKHLLRLSKSAWSVLFLRISQQNILLILNEFRLWIRVGSFDENNQRKNKSHELILQPSHVQAQHGSSCTALRHHHENSLLLSTLFLQSLPAHTSCCCHLVYTYTEILYTRNRCSNVCINGQNLYILYIYIYKFI